MAKRDRAAHCRARPRVHSTNRCNKCRAAGFPHRDIAPARRAFSHHPAHRCAGRGTGGTGIRQYPRRRDCDETTPGLPGLTASRGGNTGSLSCPRGRSAARRGDTIHAAPTLPGLARRAARGATCGTLCRWRIYAAPAREPAGVDARDVRDVRVFVSASVSGCHVDVTRCRYKTRIAAAERRQQQLSRELGVIPIDSKAA